MFKLVFWYKYRYAFFFLFLTSTFFTRLNAQSSAMLPLLPGEQWWGGAAQFGYKMPFSNTNGFAYNLYSDASGNQSCPLLISNKGRWLWCD